jgi:hypothetical protein
MARLSREREEAKQVPEVELDDLPWLNGWHRDSLTQVWMGSGPRCIGCGRSFGVACVVFGEDYSPPEKDPDWPFPMSSCPICLPAYGRP